MIIALKDLIRHYYLRFRLFLHRFLHEIRFIQPAKLDNTIANRVRHLPAQQLNLPEEYGFLSRTYGNSHQARFNPESSFVCSKPGGFTIHQGRFIAIGRHRLLDIGNQSCNRWRALEHPFQSGPVLEYESVVHPWGAGSASYGDFLIQILPKLARLLATLPATGVNIRRTTVCLPDFHFHPWAMEYLALLGIKAHQVLDGSQSVHIPAHGKLLIGTGPASTHGIAHPADIDVLLEKIGPSLPPPQSKPWRRLYISRKMGRKMANEEDLVEGLLARHFEIIQLEEMPLMDQIRLFQEASFIAGPHGAGHANIMWSAPDTRLLEVFHPSWMHPCYALLSVMRGIQHHSLVGFDGAAIGTWTPRSRFGIFENPTINPDVFFRKIDQIDRS